MVFCFQLVLSSEKLVEQKTNNGTCKSTYQLNSSVFLSFLVIVFNTFIFTIAL